MDKDKELMERIARGAADALKELTQKHSRVMLSRATRLLRNRQDAEDAVQETFIAIWRQAGSFRGNSKVMTWITGILIHKCCEILNKKQAHLPCQIMPSQHPQPERMAVLRDEFLYAVDRMNERYLQALILIDVENFSADEAADIMGVTPRNLQNNIVQNARKRMTTLRKEYWSGHKRTRR